MAITESLSFLLSVRYHEKQPVANGKPAFSQSQQIECKPTPSLRRKMELDRKWPQMVHSAGQTTG